MKKTVLAAFAFVLILSPLAAQARKNKVVYEKPTEDPVLLEMDKAREAQDKAAGELTAKIRAELKAKERNAGR